MEERSEKVEGMSSIGANNQSNGSAVGQTRSRPSAAKLASHSEFPPRSDIGKFLTGQDGTGEYLGGIPRRQQTRGVLEAKLAALFNPEKNEPKDIFRLQPNSQAIVLPPNNRGQTSAA